MSSPAGASSNQPGPASVYTPVYQGQADQSIWQTLSPLIAASANGGAGTPGGTAYPTAQSEVAGFLTSNPGANQMFNGAQTAASIGQLGGQQLGQAAGQILNTAFDPQSALFNQTQGHVIDQANAANAMAGVGNTPYGASVVANDLGNFDINWQNNQLNRQQTGLGAAQSAYPAATNLYSASSALPYTAGTTFASNALQGLGSQVNLGNSQYALPQATISDLLNYLGTGQQASTISGNLGALGLQEEQNSMSGIGNLFGTLTGGLFGNSGLFGGISNLFGGGGDF